MSESDSGFGRSSSPGQFLDMPLVRSNFTHFSTLLVYGARISELFRNVHFSLYISDSQGASSMQGTLLKCNE